MVTVSQVKDWNPGELQNIASIMRQRQQVLIHSGDDFGKVMPVEGWESDTADAAQAVHAGLLKQLDKKAATASFVIKGLDQASDAIPPVQHEIANMESLAQQFSFKVEDNGGITDLFAGKPLPPDLHPEDREAKKQEITAGIQQALRSAEDIGHDLTMVFQKAENGDVPTGHGNPGGTVAAAAAAGTAAIALTTPDPPINGTAAQNAAWWASLSPTEQQAATLDPVNKIGNLDGIPGANRSEANQRALPKMRAQLQGKLPDAKRAYEIALRSGDRQLVQQTQGDLTTLENKIKALDQIEGTMQQPGERQLLHLDTSKDLVQAAVANGNIDTAKNVAVFTPGFTTNVQDNLASYDRDMSNLRAASDAMPGGGGTATVTWMGYQEPQLDGIGRPDKSVASPWAAHDGGNDLAKFYNGIGASHDASKQPLHLTALGHSYGSTTTGYALGHNTPVNDAVLFGSPGQGADNLKVPEGHLYGEHAGGDGVPRIYGTLGPSPYYDYQTAQQYQSLSTEQSPHGGASHGHSEYLNQNTTSQHNMASIVSGNPKLAVHDR